MRCGRRHLGVFLTWRSPRTDLSSPRPSFTGVWARRSRDGGSAAEFHHPSALPGTGSQEDGPRHSLRVFQLDHRFLSPLLASPRPMLLLPRAHASVRPLAFTAMATSPCCCRSAFLYVYVRVAPTFPDRCWIDRWPWSGGGGYWKSFACKLGSRPTRACLAQPWLAETWRRR